MEGLSLGRGRDTDGNLKDWDWKGSVVMLKPIDTDYCKFVDWAEPVVYKWQEGDILPEEIQLSGKCLIKW